MGIRAVNVLMGDEILEEPVFTENGEILLPIGTILKKDYIPLIQSLGVESVMVQDMYREYEMPHKILSSEKFEYFVLWVQRLMERHIHHISRSLREFEVIANDLVKEVQMMSDDMVVDVHERSTNLYEHTVMVTLLSLMIAKKIGIEKDVQFEIALGCLLHDIGIRFITAPYKNIESSKLKEAEKFELKKHTILGYSALEEESWISTRVKNMVLFHHENMSGTGYPLKRKLREIECKIIQVCDAFDGFISGMECKRISVSSAMQNLIKDAGVIYDEQIVSYAASMIARYPVGTIVQMDNYRNAVVVSQTPDAIRPVVMFLDRYDGYEQKKYKKLNLFLEKNVSILNIM